jgi:hypothetical protein
MVLYHDFGEVHNLYRDLSSFEYFPSDMSIPFGAWINILLINIFLTWASAIGIIIALGFITPSPSGELALRFKFFGVVLFLTLRTVHSLLVCHWLDRLGFFSRDRLICLWEEYMVFYSVIDIMLISWCIGRIVLLSAFTPIYRLLSGSLQVWSLSCECFVFTMELPPRSIDSVLLLDFDSILVARISHSFSPKTSQFSTGCYKIVYLVWPGLGNTTALLPFILPGHSSGMFAVIATLSVVGFLATILEVGYACGVQFSCHAAPAPCALFSILYSSRSVINY